MNTRRTFVMSTSALVALGTFGALGTLGALRSPAAAQEKYSVLELEAKGPLEDIPLGSPTAPVTIIEYASMTCPHCAAFANGVFPKLKEKYIDTGKVRFIMREYPLDQLAAAAFMLARCAGPDKYYPLIETLFQQQPKWAIRQPIPPLLAIAKQAGFTQQSFETCLNDTTLLNKIQEERNIGSNKFKVDATPTFFINGQRYSGEMSIADLDKLLEPLIPKA
jgi:protein-disulfide isomerase